MEFLKCTKDSLLSPLMVVSGIVERKHTLPILANILLQRQGNTMTITTTDIEIQIKTSIQIQSEGNDGQTTVNAKKILDILKSLPDDKDIKLDLNEQKLQVSSGKSKFNLQTLPAIDFPEIKTSSEFVKSISITQKAFKELLNKAYYSMAVQDIRYYLNGILVIAHNNELSVVATDGHRLAYSAITLEHDLGEKKEIILPRKTVLELQRLLTDSEDALTIELNNNQIRFTFNQVELTSKLVEGKFPDYNKVIPQNYTRAIEINRLTLQQALQRVSILSNEKFKGVRCMLEPDSMKISSTNTDQENALEELDISYQDEVLDLGFNVTYLLDVLSHNKSEKICLNLGENANQSVLITTADDATFKYVVMPMRI
ncbi:MAG: DNA polymerase III subunit beta [Formosimonas sp.]